MRIHDDTMYFMYPGPNTEARTGYAQNTQVTYVHNTVYRVHQDTSGYNLSKRTPPFLRDPPPPDPGRLREHTKVSLSLPAAL